MRKTSQDGGDSTSITSGFENDLRKSSLGIIKTKRTSIKRKVQNFSLESDDTVIEPLLQIDKNEIINRSAKYLPSKSKTESINGSESNNSLSVSKSEKPIVCKSTDCPTGTIVTNTNTSRTLHNHMNTNVFGVNGSSVVSCIKSPLLVEINGSRPVIHSNQSSSIFTTAKISADSMTRNMEPIHVTPVPIISTIEGNVTKSGVSPEYQYSKTVALSPSSDVLKVAINGSNKDQLPKIPQTTNHLSDLSKPGTSGFLNKSSNMSQIKTISSKKEPMTESDLRLTAKANNVEKSVITIATVDSERTKRNVPQTQSSVKTKLDEKDSGVKKVTEIEENFPKQNISTVKTIPPSDGNITKDCKYSTVTFKQLQRQKNAVQEDHHDSDISTNKTKLGSGKIDDINKQTTSSSVVPLSKFNVEISQSIVPSNLDSFIVKPSVDVSKSLVTNSNVTAGIPAQQTQSVSLIRKDTPVETSVCPSEATSKDISSKFSTVQVSQQSASDKLIPGNQISKFKTEKSSQPIVTTNVDSTALLKEIQSTALLKLEPVKDSKKVLETPNQTSKSVKDVSVQELATKLHTRATDASTKSINSSSTTVATVSSRSSPVPTNKKTTKMMTVSSTSCTTEDVRKIESTADKAVCKSTVLLANPTKIPKPESKSKPTTTLSSSIQSAKVVAEIEPSSFAGKSMSFAKGTPKTCSTTSTTLVTSSLSSSENIASKNRQTEKHSKKD